MRQFPTIYPDACEGTGISISWQNGPIENGVLNGATIEGVIRCAIARLEQFQAGEFNSPENAMALAGLHAALAALDQRTRDRAKRGVLGKLEP